MRTFSTALRHLAKLTVDQYGDEDDRHRHDGGVEDTKDDGEDTAEDGQVDDSPGTDGQGIQQEEEEDHHNVQKGMVSLELLQHEGVLGVVTEHVLDIPLLEVPDDLQAGLQLLLGLPVLLLAGLLQEVEAGDEVVRDGALLQPPLDEEQETLEDGLEPGLLQGGAVGGLQVVEEEGLEVVGAQGRADQLQPLSPEQLDG